MKINFSKKVRSTLLLLGIVLLTGGFFLLVAVGAQVAPADPTPKAPLTKDEKRRKQIDEFFEGPIVSIEIKLEPEQFERIKKDQRNYVEATIIEGGKTYTNVGLKLKGSAGSFQGIEAKPGMSLSFDKFKGAVPFHGQKKLHLNNCAQDGTYLSEEISCAMAREAGVPASRCTHAFVKLNGRDLGIFVVKEAFTRDFLTAFYRDPGGDLWDGGFCHEIDETMQKDLGDPADKEPIKKLMAACRENDPAKRWPLLEAILDVDRFASFCVLEDFVCHWDGYNFNRNNYRVYCDAETGKISFFLHGTDQAFNDPNFPVRRDFGSMVGSAFMRCPQGAQLYRERCEQLYAPVFKDGDWPARVTKEGERLKAAIVAKDPKQAKEYDNRINEIRTRVAQRIAGLGKQLGDMPKPPQFDKDNAFRLTGGWAPQNTTGDVTLSEADKDGKKCYHVLAKSQCAASWRKEVTLPPGRYRFEAKVATAGVQSSNDDRGRGALLRISGGQGQQFAAGDTPWKTLGFEFESSGSPVVLVAELRALKGEAWFEGDSLRLVWMK